MFEFPDLVESMEEVPSEYQSLYKPGEGENAEKFVFISEARPLVATVNSLNKTLSGTRADKKKATDEAASRRVTIKALEDLAAESGITLDEEDFVGSFKKHMSELQKKIKNGEELGINMEKIQADAKRMVEEQVGVEKAKTEKMFKSLTKALIGDVAVRALTEAGALSVDLLLPHLKEKCKVVEDGEDYQVRVLDADGEARSDGKGGWFTLVDAALEMKNDPKYAPAFKSEVKGGTDTDPNSTKRTINSNKREADKSAVDKISAGLEAGFASKK